jgi:hypothetical protein
LKTRQRLIRLLRLAASDPQRIQIVRVVPIQLLCAPGPVDGVSAPAAADCDRGERVPGFRIAGIERDDLEEQRLGPCVVAGVDSARRRVHQRVQC